MIAGVIKGVLKEELDNSLRLKRNYEKELRRLPRGSLIRKKVKGRIYFYLEVWEEGKPRFIYQGVQCSKKDLEKYERAKKLRSQYKHQVSVLHKRIVFLRSSLRGNKPI